MLITFLQSEVAEVKSTHVKQWERIIGGVKLCVCSERATGFMWLESRVQEGEKRSQHELTVLKHMPDIFRCRHI